MRLLPREEKFFLLLSQHAKLVHSAANLLAEGVAANNMAAASEKIARMEEQGDALLREVVSMLRRTFITPLDPEDLHSLSSNLDNVLDDIEGASHRLAVYSVDLKHPMIQALCGQVQAIAAEISRAFDALEHHQEMTAACLRIHELEEESDKRLRSATLQLLENESNPIVVLKMKEIYDMLKRATDRAADVADVLENVAVKHT
jgi:predicted phosphate transport protein (TIGR00153 family)